ncbi:2-C-methyl-D-erythritol 4-phosphate cytidylyltransferase [Sanguibacter sp. 25GB23B1]|uniref:2-C-methyl-D-erythritol 4-phosphate cytidylyltransferase n=1 Tax=unclassified Sanguibacter TaxID=2645534 RepID=UPI0032AE8F84
MTATMASVAILTAAGSGSRLGFGYPKALVELAGRTLLAHAALGLASTGEVCRIVVTAPVDHVAAFEDVLRSTSELTVPWEVVPGGATRQASVAAGIAALEREAAGHPAYEVVLVHDAARPLAPAEMMQRIIETVRAGYSAVIPGYAVTDTMKLVAPALDASGPELVAGTADRSSLRAVQTPQGFTWDLLVRAHAAGVDRARSEETAATDDATLVEAVGETVWVVEGHSAALKITTAHDLAVARLLASDLAAGQTDAPGATDGAR